LVLCAAASEAQTPAGPAAATERPGLFRLGSFYLTPYLHIGSLGIDSNVFYTPTDRQVDFTASGGPGLEIVRPFGAKSKVRLDGGLDYLYFAKTESQRKLNGYASALFDLEGVKTSFVVDEKYNQTYSRPSYEVNARVQQEAEGTTVFLRRRLAERFSLALLGSRQRTRTDNQFYLGTNLGNTLTEDEYHAGGELRVALSAKTWLAGGGDEAWYRFPRLPERDGDSTVAYGGLRTDDTALISGQALGGMRWFRLTSGLAPTRRIPYADVNATWNISPKTKLGGRYRHDFDYSAFVTTGSTPTLVTETAQIFFDKVLPDNIYFRLFVRQSRLVSDGKVIMVTPDQGVVREVRDDRIRDLGAELGYQFRPRIRVGVTATYTKRASSISTFGIEGLIAGFTVQYNPPQPSFR
jgi:hypothetical protein